MQDLVLELSNGDEILLEVEEARLAHAERLMELAASAERALAGDEAAADSLGATAAALRGTAELDPDAAELAARAMSLSEGAVELSRDVRSYRDVLQLDPDRLEEVRARIALLGDLRRKYGADEVQVLDFLDRARARATELQGASDSGARLTAEIDEIRTRLAHLAERLTTGRREATPRLAAAMVRELEALGMEGAGVDISVLELQEIGPSGAERAEFRFSGGPSQPLLPLAKVASGGELSRTMLACRSVLADLDDVPTLVTVRHDEALYADGDALVFGPETRGLPEDVLDLCPPERRVRIPMLEGARSLNLSNAVAVAVYEAWRQSGWKG